MAYSIINGLVMLWSIYFRRSNNNILLVDTWTDTKAKKGKKKARKEQWEAPWGPGPAPRR